MLALGFLHPLLLWGLPLASVPIIIHLLNRRRFQKVNWAAMEFLLAALKRNRKRLQMEQWLVLLLRTLAILLLVFLVTRPQLTGTVLGDVRTHHVVCIDDSASMAQREGATTAFKKGLDRVKELADKLADTRQGDLFTVLRGSKANRPDMAGVRVGPQLKARVRDLVADFKASDGSLDAGRLLEQAIKRIEETTEAARAEIHLVTDFRKVDWLTEEGKPKPAVVRQLQGLDPESHRLTVLSVSPADNENLAVIDVRRAGRVAIAAVPVDLEVEVKNHGLNPSEPAELAFLVDDQSRVVRTVEALQPGETRSITFTHTFHSPGYHGITASLPTDRYNPDDSRALAVEVVDSSRVLLVDGDPGEKAEEAETYFLATALEHTESGISVQVVPEHTLGDQDLTEYDMVFLCNVPAPEAAVVEKLETFVAGGGGLAFFLGDQVHPQRYNIVFFKDGKGLLPAPLGDMAGDIDRPENVFMADKTHGTVSVATETLDLVLANFVQIGRYVEVTDPAKPPARTVLRVGGGTGSPLLSTRNFGDGGEVMMVGTTADIHWSSWPKTPAFLIITQQMHKVAAKVHDQSAFNLGPDGTLHLEIDPARYRADVAVRAMGNDAVVRTFTASTSRDESPEAPLEPTVDIPMAELDGTGLFEIVLTPHSGSRETRMLARNTPVVEGNLKRLTRLGWQRAYPEELADRVTVVESSTAQTALLKSGYGEIWRTLAMAMLAALMLESILAWRFGRR